MFVFSHTLRFMTLYTHLEFHVLTHADIERHVESERAFLDAVALSAAEGALMPSEVVPSYFESLGGREDWIGVVAFEPESRVILGSGGFKTIPLDGTVEVGYGVAIEHWGKGIGTAVCAALVRYAGDNGARVVRAHTLIDGFASQKILLKNGFELLGEVIEPDDGPVLRFEREL